MSATPTSFRFLVMRGLLQVYRRTLKGSPLGSALARLLINTGIVSRSSIISVKHGISRIQSANSAGIGDYQPPQNLLPWFNPLNIRVEPRLALTPRLNILLPTLRLTEMSGGPNTCLILAAKLAARACPVRLIATENPLDKDTAGLVRHIAQISSEDNIGERLEFVDASHRDSAVAIGSYDIFIATAWWTAQMAKYAVRLTRHDSFIYLIQDFEPLLHAASTSYALALETYSLAHIPVINTKLLLDYLVANRVGRFADSAFASTALYFEPAIDRSHFFPSSPSTARTSASRKTFRLLFYARPTMAMRNMYELGLSALVRLAEEGWLPPDRWQLIAMGEPIRPVKLPRGVTLKPISWLGFADYAGTVRDADILLSLMLSPHPSYPPLEMVCSGNLVVTNSFSVKTAKRLQDISSNIFVAEPTTEDVFLKLRDAIKRKEMGHIGGGSGDAVPSSWNDSFGVVLPDLVNRIRRMQENPARPALMLRASTVYDGGGNFSQLLVQRLETRRKVNRNQIVGLLSFITTVWNTPSEYLEYLAASLFNQDGGTNFEWVVLDNGSTDLRTRKVLEQVAQNPCVNFFRVEHNVGIVSGMRLCIERATGQYVLPLDSDDLVAPDCVLTITEAIIANNYPSTLYSDEDKIEKKSFLFPYYKPDWDPVLFVNSCYIAHLCAFDRTRALELGVYLDVAAEGCHDWDTYLRFMLAGHIPHHISDVLYSWRIHQNSTSLNIDSKSWVDESHRFVLQRFVERQSRPDHFELLRSPLFDGTPDWWVRRRHIDPEGMATITIGDLKITRADDNRSLELAWDCALADLGEIVGRFDPSVRFVHLLDAEAEVEDNEWYWEVIGLFELFVDTVMIGGLLHDGRKVVACSYAFGYEDSVESPHRGWSVNDPGYFAQLRKPRSVSAVSIAHCVIDRQFLMETLDRLRGTSATMRSISLWLGGHAARRGRRIIFTPFMKARLTEAPEIQASTEERAAFRFTFRGLIPDTRFYSPRLGLERANAYMPVGEATRRAAELAFARIALPYAQWIEREINRRRERFPCSPATVRFTFVTTVYSGSRADLLEVLARTVATQTVADFSWVIVVHGGVPLAVTQVIDKIAVDSRAVIVRDPEPLCITAAMRLAMQKVEGDYVVPIDADDMLTTDALSILGHYAERFGRPEFLYSDEDLLVSDTPTHPFLRPGFDAILNLETSYIWHLCAIRIDAARSAALYSDDGASWCHDWDSVFRIHDGGGRCMHVPEVLYHWRQHPESISNKAGGSDRSLESVRYVLEQRRFRLTHPHRFQVDIFPINRGMTELYLSRVHIDPSPIVVLHGHDTLIRLGNNDDRVPCTLLRTNHNSDLNMLVADSFGEGISYFGIVGNGLSIDLDRCYWEALRLFELHPTIGCVSGRVIGKDGLITDACWINDDGRLVNPWLQRAAEDPGPYALALKPHLVDAPCDRVAFFRVDALNRDKLAGKTATSIEVLVSDFQSALYGKAVQVAFSPIMVACALTNPAATRSRPILIEHRNASGDRGLARLMFHESDSGFRQASI